MKEDKLSTQSMDFAVSIIELVKFLKEVDCYTIVSRNDQPIIEDQEELVSNTESFDSKDDEDDEE